MITPKQATRGDIVFGPRNVHEWLPPWESIPAEFKRGKTAWNRLASAWFFTGLSELNAKTKPGIERSHALGHLKAVLNSMEPSHEHKEAGVAFLLSQWFEDGATWTEAK
jgi:hypothetical protein